MNRAMRVAWPALATAVALLSLLAALSITGAAGDPDGGIAAAAAWGVPVVQLLVNLATAGTLGVLAIAVFALGPDDPRWGRLLDAGAAAAGVWTVCSALRGLLSYLLNANIGDDFGGGFVYYLSEVAPGQVWLATTVAAATITVLCIAVRGHTGVAILGLLAVAALIPQALTGHAASDSPGDHGNAIVAFGLHIVGAAVWVGGLAVLAVLGLRSKGRPLADLASRYSGIALVCFVVVGLSGVVSAVIRIPSPADLLTPYGSLILVKSAALLVAGAAGAAHRLLLIPRIADGTGRLPFLRLVGGELVVLGVASGFAAGLAVSQPPERTFTPLTTPAEILTEGSPLPPPMSLGTVLTEWKPDVLWLLICGFLAVLYVVGVRRLARRGDRWPVLRTASWLAGVAVLAWLTSGGLNTYQEVLFSAHMMAHMALAMLVPLLLVPAAPVTLALRAIAKRHDGSRGGREWILIAVHSLPGRILANPLVAAVLFAGSLVVFYWSPLFRWATTDHIGHEWMTAHFLATGYLFVQSMVGPDPVPFRFPYPIRLLVLLATMAFHAFFGLALILGQGLLLADWYGAMGWGTSALADQQAGGAIAWSVGEIPTLVLAIVVAVSWARSDEREGRRHTRSEARTGDAELSAYNDMLARLQRGRA